MCIYNNYFRDYRDRCFRKFGDRVKYWITLNKPYTVSNMGCVMGTFMPGRCSNWQQRNCIGGDSAIEPYMVTHHLLLSHSASILAYRSKRQVRLLCFGQNIGPLLRILYY